MKMIINSDIVYIYVDVQLIGVRLERKGCIKLTREESISVTMLLIS